jgi:hypothetical protein
MMKYIKWMQRRSWLICAPTAMLFFVLSAGAQDRKTPVSHYSSRSTRAAADDPKKGKEVFDDYSTAVGTANPIAGALFKGTGEFLNLVGYFGNGGAEADAVADAIKRINERLDAHDARLAALEIAVQKVENELFQTQNLARIRKLRDFKDRLHGILDRLQPASKDRNEKIALARDAQRIAEKFLFDVDKDLWIWSDLVLKAHSWEDSSMPAGKLLEPDFKPWPTLEYYTLALVTWMTAAEYASEGDKEWVKQTFGEEMKKHITFLSIRPGWNPVSETPEALPEQVRSRVKGWFFPDKYPANMVCHFAEFTTNTIGREIRLVQTIEYAAQRSDELCTVPPGFWKYETVGEADLERAYGTDVMWILADRLTHLKNYGTVREQFVGTFSAASRTIVPAFLYSVQPNGTMLWHRHDGAEQGLNAWVGGTVVSGGWGDFKEVLPGGGNVIHAIRRDGKNLWYRHDGFNTGARREWSAAKEVGSNWEGFKSVFSGGNGVFYAITNAGKLLVYRHTGHKDGVKLWEDAKEADGDWANYKTVFSGGDGIVYAITYDGRLLWFKQVDRTAPAPTAPAPTTVRAQGRVRGADGTPLKSTLTKCEAAKVARARNSPAAPGLEAQCAAEQASGVSNAASATDAVRRNPPMQPPTAAKANFAWLGPKEIKAKGTENWADYTHVFSAGARTFGTPDAPRIALDKVVIYAIDAEGNLWWYGHRGYGTGANFLDDRVLVGRGWGDVTSVFALLPDAAEVVR